MTRETDLIRPGQVEEMGDEGCNPSAGPTMGELIGMRFGRRDLLRGALASVAISATLGGRALAADTGPAKAASVSGFDFAEIEAGVDGTHHVAAGYDAKVLLRWGDPVAADAPAFDPLKQTGEAQARQFGYNNDFVGFLPIDGSSDHGLLVVNHEYTNGELMFPGLGVQDGRVGGHFEKITPEIVAVEMAAHGGSVVEIRKSADGWAPVSGSRYNRRITAETPIEITGPAAGHERLRTAADPTGRQARGMINNCAGGLTPWGTWLTCEENFNFYFWNKTAETSPEARNARRYGLGTAGYGWGKFHERFDLAKEPREPNRFGWVVEIDPFDPTSTPKKRTALGRVKHEGAAGALAADGRYVVYLGDDERFDYVYRFVTSRPVAPGGAAANRDILDEGTLSVARYEADGTGRWMPLVHGEGPLTAANGFETVADMLIETRRASDLLGATKMDRPEDIEANPVTGRVYVMLTNNSRRKADEVNAANPRANNAFGHVVEMIPDGADHAASTFRWEILVRCGDPSVAAVGATFSSETTKNGWFGMPDNCAVDNRGRLWVATDGNSGKVTGRADGIWAVETEGQRRGTSRHFFRVPVGAEMCGPFFTPSDETLFVAVQHPGEADEGIGATFENPSTRWPDFKDGMPPRPAVLAITKSGGGKIG